MSFLPINEENKEAPQGQTTNAPVSTPPPQTSGSAGTAPSAPKSASTGTPTQFGSSASKLGDYLSANAPQITQQANTLAGNLNQQYGDLTQGITNAANQFGQQVQGGYAPNNPDVINQAVQNPVTFASNPTNVQGFQGQYNDTYTGPLAFEGTSPYTDIQNRVGQAVQQAGLLGSESGLQSYLQGQGNNPTQAMSTLDALLLRGNPEAQQTVNTAAGQFSNLPGQLTTATQGADQSVVAAQQAADQARAYAQNQFNPVMSNWQTALNNQIAANEAKRTAYNQAQNDLLQNIQAGGENLTADQIAQLGGASYPEIAAFNRLNQLNTQNYGGTTNPNLANYLTGSISPYNVVANAANSASPDDFALANAFSNLAGQGFTNPLAGGGAPGWALPSNSGAYLNTNAALQNAGSALRAGDVNWIAAHGNPTWGNPNAVGSPTTGVYGFSAGANTPGLNDTGYYGVLAALQRLAQPDYYTSVDQTLTPPTPLPPGVQLQPPGVQSGGGGHAFY